MNCQIHRARKKRSSGSVAAPRSSASRGALEFIRDGVIRASRRLSEMPRPAIEVGLAVRRLGD